MVHLCSCLCDFNYEGKLQRQIGTGKTSITLTGTKLILATTLQATASKKTKELSHSQPKTNILSLIKVIFTAQLCAHNLKSNILIGQAIEDKFSLAELLACQVLREPGDISKTCSQQEVGGDRVSELSRIELSKLPFHADLS